MARVAEVLGDSAMAAAAAQAVTGVELRAGGVVSDS